MTPAERSYISYIFSFICFSAGVGRTGTYISIDTQLERARAEGIIDVHNFVQLMRTQRVNMVQSFVSKMLFFTPPRNREGVIVSLQFVCVCV